MEFVIAIPTYKRVETLQKKTLALLHKNHIPSDKIYLFVADEDEKEAYSVIPKELYKELIVGVKGIGAQTNFIIRYFPEGTKIVRMDDDIQSLLQKDENGKMIDMDMKKTIELGFGLCDKHQLFIWSIFPVSNPYFMRAGYSTGLSLMIGCMLGFINRHDETLYVSLEEKEDVERTLKYYIKDGGCIRLNEIAIKTKFYGKGGLGSLEDRLEPSRISVFRLKELFPDFGDCVKREKGLFKGVWEFRFKRKLSRARHNFEV